MYKIRFISLFISCCTLCNAQINFLYNGNFESFSACPSIPTSFLSPEIERCIGWKSPTTGTSDYFNTCNSAVVSIPSNFRGNQTAYEGNGYCGFYAYYAGSAGFVTPTCYVGSYYTEYIQGQFINSLESGHTYKIEFQLSLSEESTLAVGQLGFYISTSAIGNSCGTENLTVVPQITNSDLLQLNDTVNWITISGSYIATGGEQFITIGNFKDSITTDTTSVKAGLARNAYYYIDGGRIYDMPPLPNTFTPNNDGMNDLFFFPGLDEGSSYQIYDRWGKKIYEGDNNNSWDGKTKNGLNCNDGVYYYITYMKGSETNKGFIQLLR